MRSKRIVGVGGANMDVHLKIDGEFILHDSNPGRLVLSPGGVTRNILDNLSRLGQDCSIITAVGDDIFGDGIIRSCRERGIDTDMVLRSSDFHSSSYISLIEGDGDMFVAACDASVLENMPLAHLDEHKERISSADAVICDTNLTEEQLKKLIALAGDVPLFIDPVSTAKAARIKEFAGSFFLIKPNLMELEVLADMECKEDGDIEKACAMLIGKGTRRMAVSLGARGCYYADSEGCSFFREPLKVMDMSNASGAGDAFTAGLVYSFVKGFSAEKTAKTALACGSIAVMSKETINPDMSEALL